MSSSYILRPHCITEEQGGVNTQFLFDRENRLKKRTDSDGTVLTNTFDGDGLRKTRQKHGETVVTYIWDGSDYLGELNT